LPRNDLSLPCARSAAESCPTSLRERTLRTEGGAWRTTRSAAVRSTPRFRRARSATSSSAPRTTLLRCIGHISCAFARRSRSGISHIRSLWAPLPAVVDRIRAIFDASQDAFGEARISAPRVVIDAVDLLQSAMVRVLGAVSDGARHGKKHALDIFLAKSGLQDAIDQYLSAIRTGPDKTG
jgi:hypothetical protein